MLASILGGVGKVYGIHYLFLDPEYLNEVGFWSFFLVGVAFANFTMAFFITSYILDSHQFSFIAILERPFLKFSLNNSFIPILVFTIYLISIIFFQVKNEFSETGQILLFIAGLILGLITFILMAFLYFRLTNKDIFKYLAGSVDKKLRKNKLSRDRLMNRWKESTQSKYVVESYLDLGLRSRQCSHLHNFYDREAILKVFDQNHFNSVLFELLIMVTILFLGLFMDQPIFQIPAAASVLMLFSIFMMMIGAITYWFKGWGVSFVVALFVVANFLLVQGVTQRINRAPGLSYEDNASYDLKHLEESSNHELLALDKRNMISILENWKSKQKGSSPKIVFQCVSGGGQRAALWSLVAMQQADSVLSGTLMDHVFMISGASGGMIGAAYYRELFRQKIKGRKIELIHPKWSKNISKDNLNPIIFSLVVNDVFFKLRTFDYQGFSYPKDRGYMFEKSLNENLGSVFEDNVEGYREDEYLAKIPMLLLSPTIANDGRKLFISPHGMSFMTSSSAPDLTMISKIKGVDMGTFFKDQGADNVPILTALRMSASFPYITPTLSLPSTPRIEIMDAGISDNFGVSDALQFMYTFRDWIASNTGGVVLLILRDSPRISETSTKPFPSIIDRFTSPISSVYNNLANMQDINNEKQIQKATSWLDAPIDVVEIAYDSYTQQETRASLSWHLTSKEKKTIVNAAQIETNRRAIQRLNILITDKNEFKMEIEPGHF